MSLKTWLEEFYPVEAKKAISSDEEALEHSLNKWGGTTKKNLEKHKVTYHNYSIRDENGSVFEFYSKTCALCHRYDRNSTDREDCFSENLNQYCPIVSFRGYPCDTFEGGSYLGNGLTTWDLVYDKPVEMVKLLRKVKKI